MANPFPLFSRFKVATIEELERLQLNVAKSIDPIVKKLLAWYEARLDELSVDDDGLLTVGDEEVVTTTRAQTIINKTISGASNTLSAINLSSLSSVYWSANGSTTSCNNNTLTNVAWTNEALDSAGAFNGTTFTCPSGQAGIYVAATLQTMQSAAYTEKTALLLKNGSQAFNHINQDTEAVYHSQLAVGIMQLAVSDTVTAAAYQTNGAAAARGFLNNNALNYFFGFRIA